MVKLDVGVDSKALRKLIDVVASGMGAVFRPWMIRRDARANADAMEIFADGTVRAQKVLHKGHEEIGDGKEPGSILAIPAEPQAALDSLRERTEQRLLFQEMKRQGNLEAIARGAAEELPDEVSDDDVDPDWVARFFQAAQDVSTEQMQILWSRLLAGEVAMPGSHSLRTIDALKNMTQAEAQLFAKVARYRVEESIFDLGNEFWESQELSFGDFLKLHELGLLIMGAKLGLAVTVRSKEEDQFLNHLIYGDRLIQIEHENPKMKIEIGCYKLTRVGLDLSHLIRAEESPEYLRAVAKKIAGPGKGAFKVSAAKIRQRFGDGSLNHGPFEMLAGPTED